MPGKKNLSAVAVSSALLLSYLLVVLSPNVASDSVTWTSDFDYSSGNFYVGTPFETELHGTGVDAYVQIKRDMMNWFHKSPPSSPGQRSHYGLTNNSHESRFIFFGGLDQSSSVRNDTWEYDLASANWVRICADDTATCNPPKRSSPSMAYDNDSKVAVMFGGIDGQARILEDTWEYDVVTNTWTNWSSALRPRRIASHSMVYSADEQKLILVGRGDASMEVWSYDSMTHTWMNRSAPSGPPKRSGFALGYSYQPNHQRVVFFGGAELTTPYNDTWEYDYAANSWSQVTPTIHPNGRAAASMTYNFAPSAQGLLLWGGTGYTTETWRYNWTAGSPVWSQVSTVTAPTPARIGQMIAYDPTYDAMILFGGSDFSGLRLNDSWVFEKGYRLAGKYASSFFNSHDSLTQWEYVYWNWTSPPSTTIRFQLDSSNSCEDADQPIWRGPGGSPSTYYTTSGMAIWAGLNPSMCIRFLADMITMDPSVAPALQDVTISYEPGDPNAPPKVIGVSPSSNNAHLHAPIYINFSKPMDTSTVFISLVPNHTFDFPWIWYQGDTKLKITHSSNPFQESQRYDICVFGNDTRGQPLNHTNDRYCWLFTTIGTAPFVIATSPASGATNVQLNVPIIFTFSEPMNTNTCWPYVTITPSSPAFDGHIWSSNDTTLTLTHSALFAELTTYTVDLPVGDPTRPCTDKAGLLIQPGPVPIPWSFRTKSVNPIINSTNPSNLETSVAVNRTISLDFSADIDVGAFAYLLREWNQTMFSWVAWTGTFTVVWISARIVALHHTTPFAYCKPYQMQIWAQDESGRPLIANPDIPNPWRFQTDGIGGECPPFIFSTNPSKGEQNVAVWRNVSMAWRYSPDAPSGGMDPASFSFYVDDGWGNNITSHFVPEWLGPGPDVVELKHPGYQLDICRNIFVRVIAARDKAGRDFIPGLADNPFGFETVKTNCPPVIISTQPWHGETGVPLKQSVKVMFSEEMDPASVSVTIVPNVTFLPPAWSEGNKTLTLVPDTYVVGTWYNITINGSDLGGIRLAPGPLPNPWMFRAWCGPCSAYVIDASPTHEQVDVPLDAPIWINFSEPMVAASLIFTLTPLVGTLNQTWLNNDSTVVIHHDTPYLECGQYAARILVVRTKSGLPFGVGSIPNPWTFRARCIKPYIVSTMPPDGSIDVGVNDDIIIVFSEPMDQASLVFSTTPFLSYTEQWTDSLTVILSHATPYTACMRYVAIVWMARDLDGNDLVPDLVPNPWDFSTGSCPGIRGLEVHRSPPGVFLTWRTDPSFSYYFVHHSNDRFAPWPWPVIANVSAGYAAFPDHISDMSDHFYLVKGKTSAGWSANSTMGALWHVNLDPNPGSTNAFWFSLPYNSTYHKASDIAKELTAANISVIGKWDPVRQNSILYYHFHGCWRGQDFAVNPGDGLWIGVLRAFDWAVNGSDKTLSFIFTYGIEMRTSYYWIGLPFTGTHKTASDLVTSIEGGLGPGNNTKIVAVGKWIFDRQSSEVFEYTPTGWSGIDFTIMSGDGIWIRIVSSFAWIPGLITPKVP